MPPQKNLFLYLQTKTSFLIIIIIMAKKSAITGEYIITVEDSGAIRVCQIYDNVIESLRQCAKEVGFKYDADWNTRQFGKKIIDSYGSGNIAEIGEYTISRTDSGHVDTYRVFGNTIAILRKIASSVGLKPQSTWNTRYLGAKLVDFINGVDSTDEVVDEGFKISPEMTTIGLYDAFTKEFGTHLRIKKGVKRCDPNKRESIEEIPLSEAGLTEAFTINGEMTVSEVESLAAEKGLKLQVATIDDWTTALPQTPLDSVRFMPRNTTKEKMQEILDRQ